MSNRCLSGGARGADVAWGEAAARQGHEVVHFTFDRHHTTAPRSTICKLSQHDLDIADPYLLRANKRLGRRWPIRNLFVANLLRRNYFQIAEANSLYAISTFDKNFVAGGTGWAVAMFLDRFANQDTLPCYVFDQEKNSWTQWEDGGFLEINYPPQPNDVWAGIGTRELNDRGLNAIYSLWDY